MATRTRVNTVTCPECRTEIYSRARHDFRTCGCRFTTFVDGGFDYFRHGGTNLDRLVCCVRYVNATRTQLYADWNLGKNVFGIIGKKGQK